MGIKTDIAWTDRTWNPWQGCHKVSEGCKFCYMERDKKRYGQDPFTVVRSKPHTFNAPISDKWAEPGKKIFVCSWSDFFIEEADPWRAEAWAIIQQATWLTFQICTKRPERIAKCLPATGCPKNVWLGVTCENQATADERIPLLLGVKAPVRFLSVEPMLGPVNVGWDALGDLDWVIVGAESGGRARPMSFTWARVQQRDCAQAGVAFFVKQLHLETATGRKVSTDPSEWPLDLRVREFPKEQT